MKRQRDVCVHLQQRLRISGKKRRDRLQKKQKVFGEKDATITT
jgi:hypothetical protein